MPGTTAAGRTRLPRFSPEEIARELDRGAQAYEAILSRRPATFAAPAWLSRGASLLHQEGMGLAYASDCRGSEPFLPVVGGHALATPQVPATLPTLDEMLGGADAGATAFYARMLDEAERGPWPVLTIHAELEGGPFAPDFKVFLAQARDRGIQLMPLKDLLAARLATGPLSACPLAHRSIPGRHGVVSLQMPAL